MSAKRIKKASEKELVDFLNWLFDSIQFYSEISHVTQQSSNIGLGYLSQMLVSLITGIPGNKSGSNGDDLNDGSEVKSAFMDFTHDHKGEIRSKDLARYNKLDTAEKAPHIFLVRWEVYKDFVRVCVAYPNIREFRSLRIRYLRENSAKNLQLHPFWEPPIITVVTNSSGYLIDVLPKRRNRGLKLNVLFLAKKNFGKKWRNTYHDNSECWLNRVR